MKIQRTKRAKKTLQFFSIAYGAAPPYHVLLDGTFLHRAASVHQEIPALIARALNTEKFKLYTTAPVRKELENLKLQEGLDAIRGLGRGITVLPSPAQTAQDSIVRLVRAPELPGGQSFILATRDPGLVREARMYPRTMIIQLNGVVATLETPSNAAVATYRKAQKAASHSRLERARAVLSGRAEGGSGPGGSGAGAPGGGAASTSGAASSSSAAPARRVLPDFAGSPGGNDGGRKDELYDPLEPSREDSEEGGKGAARGTGQGTERGTARGDQNGPGAGHAGSGARRRADRKAGRKHDKGPQPPSFKPHNVSASR